MAAAAEPVPTNQMVTYEAFGAVGDGIADDLPAICKAHVHANEHGLTVRSNPSATYHLGKQALTAIIQTPTDWGTSKFIIDDSHDFGYPCDLPRVIRIEGLFVDNSKHADKHLGALFFDDPIAGSQPDRPFPYRLTRRLEVSGLKTASSLPMRIGTNPEVAKAIKVVENPPEPASGSPSD